MNSQDFLYHQAIEKEKIERLSSDYKNDYELVDKLRKELFDNLEIKSTYLADLTHRMINDDKCIFYLAKYIPLFNNIGISLDLIKQQFYRKGNEECSNFMEKWYFNLKRNDMLNPTIENTIDNVLSKIQDKDKISFYLELIKDNNKFPFVMVMLARWKIEEAKPLIINRLKNDDIKTNAIKALGYYKDKTTLPLIEKYLNSEYSGVRRETHKVIKKLNEM